MKRIVRVAVIPIGAWLSAGHLLIAGQTPKYDVTVKVAKRAELAAMKTYTWTVSQPAADKTVDAQIRAAVDRELLALALTKPAAGRGDLVVTYGSVSRTDVDVNAKAGKDGTRPQRAVGTLIVELRGGASRETLFQVRIDKPIEAAQPGALESEINSAVAAMFEKYPTRQPAKR